MSHEHDRLLRASTARGFKLSLGTTVASAAKGLVLPQSPTLFTPAQPSCSHTDPLFFNAASDTY